MKEKIIKAEIRVKSGKEYSKKLRREGKIPGIFYSKGSEPIPFACDLKELKDIEHYGTSIITVMFDGKKVNGLIKEIQYDLVSDGIIHIDIMGIELTKKVCVEVPVVIKGTAVGVKDSEGILEQITHKIEIECLPTDIPERIEVDVSELNIGNSIHVGDLKIENAKIITKPDFAVITIVPPTVIKEVVEAAPSEEEEKEPEVIQKDKEKEIEKEPEIIQKDKEKEKEKEKGKREE